MLSHLLIPHAPLGPVVRSQPTRSEASASVRGRRELEGLVARCGGAVCARLPVVDVAARPPPSARIHQIGAPTVVADNPAGAVLIRLTGRRDGPRRSHGCLVVVPVIGLRPLTVRHRGVGPVECDAEVVGVCGHRVGQGDETTQRSGEYSHPAHGEPPLNTRSRQSRWAAAGVRSCCSYTRPSGVAYRPVCWS